MPSTDAKSPQNLRINASVRRIAQVCISARPSTGTNKKILTCSKQCTSAFLRVVVVVGTLPYYRFFHFNTLGIIRRIALYRNRPSDFDILLRLLVRWRERKVAELQFISIAVSRHGQKFVSHAKPTPVRNPCRRCYRLVFVEQRC